MAARLALQVSPPANTQLSKPVSYQQLFPSPATLSTNSNLQPPSETSKYDSDDGFCGGTSAENGHTNLQATPPTERTVLMNLARELREMPVMLGKREALKRVNETQKKLDSCQESLQETIDKCNVEWAEHRGKKWKAAEVDDEPAKPA
eukprot:gene23963-9535_t